MAAKFVYYLSNDKSQFTFLPCNKATKRRQMKEMAAYGGKSSDSVVYNDSNFLFWKQCHFYRIKWQV